MSLEQLENQGVYMDTKMRGILMGMEMSGAEVIKVQDNEIFITADPYSNTINKHTIKNTNNITKKICGYSLRVKWK